MDSLEKTAGFLPGSKNTRNVVLILALPMCTEISPDSPTKLLMMSNSKFSQFYTEEH